jgi:hypothetical protein
MRDDFAEPPERYDDDVAPEAARATTRGPATEAEREVSEREVAITRDTASQADVTVETSATPLLAADVVEGLRTRWNEIQAGFVDEPRRAVEQADALVEDAIKHLSDSFASARAAMERGWDRGEDVSTEDLRLALQRYRAFFGRLLEV